MNSNKNPIYLEWYPHTNCFCYKIDLPFTRYQKHVMVLCLESEGLEKAKEVARYEILKHLNEAMKQEIKSN